MSYILDTQYQSNTIFLNSARALTRNPFTFNFSNIITCPTNMKLLISLEEFVIPNIFFNITLYNNNIEFNKIGYSNFIIVVPIGIYNINNLVNKINELLLINLITCVYNTSSFKLSFVATFNFSIVSSTMSNIIGVNKNERNEYIFPILAGSPIYTLYMPSTIDLCGSSYFFLKCNELILSNINSYGIINNTFARIPINSPYGYKIYYRPTESIKFISSKANINVLTFYLEDIFNNPIDIFGNEFQMLIKIDYVYTPVEKNDILSGTLEHYVKNLTPEPEPDEDENNIF